MSTRAERAERARKRKCRNCGEDGPHFVPPSFGDRGFYICTPPAVPDPRGQETESETP